VRYFLTVFAILGMLVVIGCQQPTNTPAPVADKDKKKEEPIKKGPD
jgi:hypothetical protein